MPATIDDASTIESIGKATEEWMLTLPEDRRIDGASTYMAGFDFITTDSFIVQKSKDKTVEEAK